MKQIKIPKNFFVPKNKYEQEALEVYNLLVENFSETFFVGGMVRNLFWKKKIIDIDIATSTNPNKIIQRLIKHGYQPDTRAGKLGVVTVPAGKTDIQITTFRKDVYSKTRYPKIAFVKSFAVDAKRRDFTINSLYFHAKTNIVYNPVNGYDDIKKKILRSIGNPDNKFQEDPLRIVRAWRFYKQFSMQLDKQTALSLDKHEHLIKQLTKTKIKSEINKTASQNIKKFLTKKFI